MKLIPKIFLVLLCSVPAIIPNFALAADQGAHPAVSRIEQLVEGLKDLGLGTWAYTISGTAAHQVPEGMRVLSKSELKIRLHESVKCDDSASNGEWLLARSLSYEKCHWEFLPKLNQTAIFYTGQHLEKLKAAIALLPFERIEADYYLWQIELRRTIQLGDRQALECLNVLLYLTELTNDLSESEFRRSCFAGDPLCLFLLCSDPTRQVLLTGLKPDPASLSYKQENDARKLILAEELLKDSVNSSPRWHALNRVIATTRARLTELENSSKQPSLVAKSNKKVELAVRKFYADGDLAHFFGPDAQKGITVEQAEINAAQLLDSLSAPGKSPREKSATTKKKKKKPQTPEKSAGASAPIGNLAAAIESLPGVLAEEGPSATLETDDEAPEPEASFESPRSAEAAGGGGYSLEPPELEVFVREPPHFLGCYPICSVILSGPVQEAFAKLSDWQGLHLLVGGAVHNLLNKRQLKHRQDLDFVMTLDHPGKLTSQGLLPSPYCPMLFACDAPPNPMECFIIEPRAEQPLLIEDSLRRDFTIASLYCDKDGNIFDPTMRGLRDFHSQVLDTIIQPGQSFHDDPIRLLRAVKYITLGFRPSFFVQQALFQWNSPSRLNPPHLHAVARKMLRTEEAPEYVRLLCYYGLLEKLFGILPRPSIDGMLAELRQLVKFRPESL